MRVKGGIVTRRKHKKILEAVKGYRMTKSRLHKPASDAYLHAGEYAFAGRRLRRRDLRRLWIVRINAALDPFDISYSQFTSQLKKANINLDRKILAELAANQPATFSAVVKTAFNSRDNGKH